RRAGDDSRHTRDFRREDAHVRRRDHRITPAGKVAAYTADWNVPVTKRNAGQRFDLDVDQRRPLCLGTAPYLRLRELDILDGLFGQTGDDRVDLRLCQPERLWRPPVKANRQVADRSFAARTHVVEDLLNGFADLAVCSGGFGGLYALFQV